MMLRPVICAIKSVNAPPDVCAAGVVENFAFTTSRMRANIGLNVGVRGKSGSGQMNHCRIF